MMYDKGEARSDMGFDGIPEGRYGSGVRLAGWKICSLIRKGNPQTIECAAYASH